MKASFINKIRLIICLVSLLVFVEGIFITNIISHKEIPEIIKTDIRNTVYICDFFIFFITLITFLYLPIFLRSALAPVKKIVSDISGGNYNLKLDKGVIEKSFDSELEGLAYALARMVGVINRFDSLKKEKILEQTNRLNALLSLTENGFLILDINGEIKYLNDTIREFFPVFTNLNDNETNITEIHFQPELENSIKKYTVAVLSSRAKQDSFLFFMQSLKRHVTFKSSIVKDNGGVAIGAVIGVFNLRRNQKEDE